MSDVVYKSLLLNSINHYAYCNARIECTKDDKMDFEKTTIQLRLAESIYLKTNKNARKDKRSTRTVRSDKDEKVQACVAKIHDILDTDHGEATIKAYLTKSKDNHIPSSIWNKLDYDTRNKILEIRKKVEGQKVKWWWTTGGLMMSMRRYLIMSI